MERESILAQSSQVDETLRGQLLKKRYEKPEIIYRAPLEAMAVYCYTTKQEGKTTFLGCLNLGS